MRGIGIFDFDGTLYKGDTTIDFAFFIFKKFPLRFYIFFIQLIILPLFLLKIIPTKTYKNIYILFLKNIDPDKLAPLIKEFWDSKYPTQFNTEVIRHFLQNKQKGIMNICISASPDILINEFLMYVLQFNYVIATKTRYKNGRYIIEGENCKGKEKLNRLNELFANEPYYIENAFSDNKDDLKLLHLALKGYAIEKNKIIEIKDERD